ncbi:MAG TPA: hypothetical protein IAA26_13890 [Candidatus Blautia faecipullorum]|nr:hypothetical protein [Candidatus Blautia faecipullorum]
MEEYLKDSNWIWTPQWTAEDKEIPRIVLFRKTAELFAEPKKGSIRISADTRYKLYINGRLVETGPSRGDHQIWFYDEIDILPYLKKGKNVIGVSVLRYPEDPAAGNHGMFRTSVPGLYVTGAAQDMEDNICDLSADASWRCRKDELVSFYREEERFAPLVIHEHAEGSKELFGWRECEYREEGWLQAKAYIRKQVSEAVSPGNLKPRNIPFLYRKKRRLEGVMDLRESSYTENDWMDFINGEKALTIPAHTEETVVLDAGVEKTGYIRLALSGGTGARADFLYSEAYVQEGFVGPEHIPVKKDRTDKINGHLQGYEDYYRAGGFGTAENNEVYEPYWFRTFRFIRLRIRTEEEPLTIHSLDYEETGYPLEVSTEVETSDESLKKIWEISERTLKLCMHETYEDCPFYEQLQYIMDSRTQILYTYAVSGDDRLARKCLDDLRRSQRYDGLLNCNYPNCNPNIIPGFSIYYILMLYDHMMYFGDREIIAAYMPVVEQILHFFERHLTKEGYVEKVGGVNMDARFWSFIDWAEEWNDTSGMPTAGLKGPLTMESLLYIYGLQHAARLMEYLERSEDVKRLSKRAEDVQRALLKYCVGENGMLQDGPGVEEYSQHCQVFALLTDTVDLETGKRNLLRTINEKGFTQCTVAMRFYLFRALEKAGLYRYTDMYWNTWREMIRNHCTTCVESEAYARSECHGWGALILYELPAITLGVRPAAPGCRKLRIAPVTGYMTHASGKVKTPAGEVKVSWRIQDGAFKIDYEVPRDIEVVR